MIRHMTNRNIQKIELLQMQANLNDYTSIRRFESEAGLETMKAHYVHQTFKPHAHEGYVIGVIEGGIHDGWCRGEYSSVGPGTIVLVNPGDIHFGGPGDGKGWIQRTIYISEKQINQHLSDLADNRRSSTPNFRSSFITDHNLSAQFSQLHETLHSSQSVLTGDVALTLLFQIIRPVIAPSITFRSPPPSRHKISNVVEYLHEHVEQNVTLEELCKISGLSRRQTIHAFKLFTGLPPHAYHIGRKIERVKTLLRQGLPAVDAAALVGFADQSHMTRHFLTIVGMTPHKYARGEMSRNI